MTAPLVVGVPIDSVGVAGGTELGPRVLRERGIVEVSGGTDGGDLDVRVVGTERDRASGVVGFDSVARTTAVLRDAFGTITDRDRRFLVLGGCCTMAVGIAAGVHDALGPTGVAYLDGHTDLYPGTSSPTGEAADMPLSVLFGRGPEAWRASAGGVPELDPERVELLGFRDRDEARSLGATDPSEIPGLRFRDLDAVRAAGTVATATQARDRLSERGPYWVFVDFDVLSTDAFPATDALQDGGMAWSELTEVLELLVGGPSCLGLALACYNPEKDPDRSSAERIVELASRTLGG